MTTERKKELVETIAAMLQDLISEDDTTNNEMKQKTATEMVTIKEASEQIKGLSEHTVRQLVHQGKIPSIRTGAGENGKILIPKNALINYVNGKEV